MERRVALSAVALLVAGFVGASYVPDWIWQSGVAPNYRLLSAIATLSVFLLIPLGAGLASAANALRYLRAADRDRYLRLQILVAIALVLLGLAVQLWGDLMTPAIDDALGGTGQAGSAVANLLLRLLAQTALPLGIALLAFIPVQMRLRVTEGSAPAR